MGRFSDLLGFYLKRQDARVADLADHCAVNRSMMYKIVQGKRALSDLSLVEPIASFLRLSQKEKESLKEAYMMDEDGEFVIKRRNMIHDMLCCYPAQNPAGFVRTSIHVQFPEDQPDVMPLQSESQINQMVLNVMLSEASKENARICVYSTVLSPSLTDSISYVLSSCPDVRFDHIIGFSKSRSDAEAEEHNLTSFSRIIRFCTQNRNYNAWAAYSASAGSTDLASGFSTFFLTSCHVILLSNDLSEGILFHKLDMVNLYADMWKRLAAQAVPVVRRYTSVPDIIKYLSAYTLPQGTEITRLEPFPCLFGQIDAQLIQEAVNPEIPGIEQMLQTIVPYLASYQEKMNTAGSAVHNIHSVRGFRTFAETGILPELPPVFYRPFSHSQKVRLLNNYLNRMDQMDLLFMKEERTDLPDTFCLSLMENTVSLQFTDTDSPLVLSIMEPGIYLDFKDYVDFLTKDPSLFLSKEEVKGYLNDLIHHMEK